MTPYKCPKCGFANAMGSRVCKACGAALREAMGKPPLPPAPPAPPAARPVRVPRVVTVLLRDRPAAAARARLSSFRLDSRLFRKYLPYVKENYCLAIVAACTTLSVFVWILELSGIAGKHSAAAVLGLSATGVFRHFYFFEILTAPLLHDDWMRLVFNMLTLYSLGPPVERLLGKRQFLELSAIGVGASSLAFLFANLQSGAISVGYNSGVLAVLLAQAIYFPERQLVIYGIFPLRMRLGALLIGAITFLSAPAGSGLALLGGVLAALIYLMRRGPASPLFQRP